jgi:uncharacterized membrane protein YvlD (DUF360 family)
VSEGSRRWRFRLSDVVRLLVVWCVAAALLAFVAWLLPGLSATTPWAWFAASAIAAVAGLLVRPALVMATARLGWIGIVLGALFGQAAIVYFSFLLVPSIQSTFWTAFWAAWIVAVGAWLMSYVVSAGTDDAFEGTLVRRLENAKVDDPELDGVIFVQLDGVPFPVLRWAVLAGSVPTIRRWIATGDYRLHEWIPQLPCTTPASQLGLLHGTVDRIPAFRWYDRELGRVLVANRPKDAAVIEERASNGRGLLADGGLSLSNLFTGDAPRAMLVMSRVELTRGTTRTRETIARYLMDPRGFARGFLRVLGEIIKERFQAVRQTRRNLEPRTHRGWTFAALRAATNVLVRDLNTSVIADEMARGTRSIYVDYVDYDEIAHHAGLFRPESLAALDGLDRVMATLARLAEKAPRRYHIVAVSDHGQSQGDPFASRYGQDLGTICQNLMDQAVETVDAAVEGWGQASAVADGVAGRGLPGMVAGRAAAKAQEKIEEGAGDPDAEISVLGSGNLGLLYVHGPDRLTLDDIDRRWPALVPGLVNHEGVGFVAGVDAAGHRIVLGPAGRRDLDSGETTGQDPLAPFGQYAADQLAQALAMTEAPDLYMNSSMDPVTLDIAAFEPLVGAHGGLGGWQDSAVLLVPKDLDHLVPAEPVQGADRVHQVLVSMLESVGHRRDAKFREPAPEPAPDPAG